MLSATIQLLSLPAGLLEHYPYSVSARLPLEDLVLLVDSHGFDLANTQV